MANAMVEENPYSHEKSTVFSQEEVYQSVCKSAVTSVIFGVLGLAAFLTQSFVILPLLGVIFGLLAFKALRDFPEELVGKGAARFGFLLSAVCLVSSISMHSFIYATEVPDGYRRISFAELKPGSRATNLFPERAKELDGQRVFIKGYVRPPSGKQYNLSSFIMVGDFGDCCFGGDPNINEVIAVKIVSDDTVNYGYGLRRIGGTFRLNPETVPSHEDEIPRVLYELEADHVR